MVLIDAWGNADLKIDESLIKEFGLKKLADEQRQQYQHYLFERGIIIAHRDLELIEKAIENKKPFGQLTGIASSGPLHFGHKVDADLFLFFRSLGAKSLFAVCDIDAYCSRPDTKIPDMKTAKENAVNNAAHLLALGIRKEEIYVQSRQPSRYFELAFEVSKKITENTFRGIYGHLDLGKVGANLLQYADILHIQLPEFFGLMPTITGIGVDQDPHARAARDIVKKLPYKMFPPSFIYFQHQGGLQEGVKMSSSQPETAIFLDDSSEDACKKIDRAYSGGRDNIEQHRKLGGMPDKDKTFELLKFHHPDTKLVEQVYNDYRSGKMLTGELKKIAKGFVTKFLEQHQQKVKKELVVAKKLVYG